MHARCIHLTINHYISCLIYLCYNNYTYVCVFDDSLLARAIIDVLN